MELALIRDPSRLATEGQVKLKEVLGCATMGEFIARRAALRAHQESHDDIALLAFAADELGLPVFESGDERAFLEYAILVRHCLVHNGGRPNARLRENPLGSLLPDQPMRISMNQVPRLSMCLLNLSNRVCRSLQEESTDKVT